MYQELGKFIMLSMMVLICLGILSWLAVLYYRIIRRLLLDDIKMLIQTELNKQQEGSY